MSSIYIISLKDAVETELKYTDQLTKTDKIIFTYPKGCDSISLKIYEMLKLVKAETEFVEMPEDNHAVYIAYLIGLHSNSGKTVYLVDTNDESTEIFKDIIKPIKNFRHLVMVNGKPKFSSTASKEPTRRKRKSSTNESTITNVEDTTAENTKVAINEESMVYDLTPLKEFLDSKKDDAFNPAEYTSLIFKSCIESYKKGMKLSESIQEILPSKIVADNVCICIKPCVEELTEIVKKILKS